MVSGNWPPGDLQIVLMAVPSTELKTWVAAQALPRPSTEFDAVLAALTLPELVLSPFYEENKLRTRTTAVTWFRNVDVPQIDHLVEALPIVDPRGDASDERRLFRVWIDPEAEILAVRLAYAQAKRLIRRGLELAAVSQFGLATFVWRQIDGPEPLVILEAHSHSVWTRRLLRELLSAGHVDHGQVEVLDIRENSCPDSMCIALGGTLTDGVADIDDPGVPDDKATFSAKAGRDLNEPGAKFAEYAHYPGRG